MDAAEYSGTDGFLLGERGSSMHTERSYRHPLSGDLSSDRRGVVSSGGPFGLTVAVWALVAVLCLILVGGSCVAFKAQRAAGKIATQVVDSIPALQYEPLSTVNDGSYAEEPASGRAKSLGILKRLRSR